MQRMTPEQGQATTSDAGPTTWPRRYWHWLLKPRGNRRRHILNLTLMGLGLLAVIALTVWFAIGHRWVLIVAATLTLPEDFVGIGEELTMLDLQDLGVSKRAKPAELVKASPPGSALHRTALRAVRLHRARGLAHLMLGIPAVLVASAL